MFSFRDLRSRGWPRLLAFRRVAAVVLVLLAAALALRPTPATGPTVPMLVAAHDLPPGVTLRATDVRVVRSPPPLRPATALTSPAETNGRVLASATTSGEPLTKARLVGPSNSRLTTGDPSAVAVPFRLADPAVAGLLTPGARVDVVTVSQENTNPLILAENATVLTVRPVAEPRTAAEGHLVVIALPSSEATRVAAAALGQPVAVTLR